MKFMQIHQLIFHQNVPSNKNKFVNKSSKTCSNCSNFKVFITLSNFFSCKILETENVRLLQIFKHNLKNIKTKSFILFRFQSKVEKLLKYKFTKIMQFKVCKAGKFNSKFWKDFFKFCP